MEQMLYKIFYIICTIYKYFFQQARFALTFISGGKKMSKPEMQKDMLAKDSERRTNSIPRSRSHVLAWNHHKYYRELSNTAGITNVPEIISEIFTNAL